MKTGLNFAINMEERKYELTPQHIEQLRAVIYSQAAIDEVWKNIGDELGFDWESAYTLDGGNFFMAEPKKEASVYEFDKVPDDVVKLKENIVL